MTTAADGSYSGQLPVGTYSLTYSGTNLTTVTEAASITAGQTVTKNVVMVPTAPLAATVTGDTTPGGTFNIAATLYGQAGTVTWAQKSGAPVTLPDPAEGTSIQVTLPDVSAFKDELFTILEEQPNAYLERTMVVAINPLDLEEMGTVVLTATVTPASGPAYTQDVSIQTVLPFDWSTGIQTQPIGRPVLLHTLDGESYNWSISLPAGSQAALQDATTQNPYFTPDIRGKYTLTETVSGAKIDVWAGKWVGVYDQSGGPSSACTICHNSSPEAIAPDKFTPWLLSGHAQIFTKNLNAGGHYSSACFPCHTVGYDLAETEPNNGFDDQPDYQAMLNEFFPGGHSPTPNPNNWANMLAKYPASAKLANIQCENCHGPQDTPAHPGPVAARVSISSNVCGRCHGEPPRHGRFQEWQRSKHADFELALDEATVEGRGGTAAHCGRCHAGQGFLQWIQQGDLTKQIQGANGNATVAELTAMGLTVATVQPQTCATCHDPHAQGNGGANATVRIEGSTSMLPAGFVAYDVGKGALCITCHNTRNGAHNDNVGAPTSYSAPHVPSQGDLLMGQNAYFVDIPQRSRHSFLSDTCVTCHMVLSPPPPDISLPMASNPGQTNHQFNASLSICSDCHGDFDGGTLQQATETGMEELANAMDAYLMARIVAAGTISVSDYTPHTYDGTAYDVKSAPVAVPASDISGVEPTEPHGQQGYIVYFNTPVTFTYSPPGESPHTQTLQQATVQLGDILGSDGTTALIATSDPLVRAGWNYFLVHGDGSKGVHNPSFVNQVLNNAIVALQ